MSAGKVSIFITVISLHACVLGIVYVSTRQLPAKTAAPEISNEPVVKKPAKTPLPKKTVSVKKSPVKTAKTVKGKTAAKPTASVNGKYRIHTVGPNDYLGKIASKYNVTSKSIIKLNGIKDPNLLNRGQKLKIPLN